MQIVIDIPDEVYEEIMDGIEDAGVAGVPLGDLAIGFRDGTVLPKGHGRLIDADELLRYIDSMQSWLNENGYRVIRRIKLTDYIQGNLPTIIEADKEVDE